MKPQTSADAFLKAFFFQAIFFQNLDNAIASSTPQAEVLIAVKLILKSCQQFSVESQNKKQKLSEILLFLCKLFSYLHCQFMALKLHRLEAKSTCAGEQEPYNMSQAETSGMRGVD